MKKNLPLKTLTALAFFSAGLTAKAEIPLEYYSSLQGLKGAQLKTAVHQIVGQDESIVMLSYGSGQKSTWWGFYLTDRYESNNEVVDRYSNDARYFGNRGSSVSGMNIEHSFPKSWWGGSTSVNAYKDLYNLMPCEQSINSSKSNYPMGQVTSVTTTNGCTNIGSGSNGYKMWEPADRWKGDFARGYMYMATAYQDYTWSGTQALQSLQQGAYPTLQKWAYELYLQWARQDDVSDMEVTRNENVHSIQGNRNPFVDFPNLMEYIWGDSTDVAFDIRTTRKSSKSSGVILDPSEELTEVYACTFLDDEGNCTVEYDIHPAKVTNVWINTEKYGWKASAFTNNTKYAADATLLTPEIDLTGYSTASLTFEHACNFAATPANLLSVGVSTDGGEVTPVDIAQWPSGTDWTFVNSGKTDLNKFAGKKIRLAFRYTSNTSEAPTWEIRNLSVKAMGIPTGIGDIPAYLLPEKDNSAFPVEFYSTDGRRVDPDTYRGIVIRRQGTSVSKILLR